MKYIIYLLLLCETLLWRIFKIHIVTAQVFLFYFFYWYCGNWRPYWVHAALRPCIGLLYLPRVIVRMEKLVE
jgi:hypothetical protein